MPPIKNLWLFVVSMVAAAAVLYFVVDRVVFLARAQDTVGEVISVSAANDRCGSRRNRHNCTVFSARVRYRVNQQDFEMTVTAGSERGHDRPLSSARYGAGAKVPVTYNPRRPKEAYRDEWHDVWGTPLMTFFVQIGTLFGSFSERRRTV